MTQARKTESSSAIPALESHCGSWVCSHAGSHFETFSRRTAERAASIGYHVETAAAYLARINRESSPGIAQMAEEADNIMDRYIRARAKRIASDPKDAANAHYQLGVAIAMLDHLLIQRGDLARITRNDFNKWRKSSAKEPSNG